HCIDPRTDLVLNPAAWLRPDTANGDTPAGQFSGSAVYFDDYRTQRRPQESMSFGRVFRIREKMSLSARIEFTNVFNRTQMNNASTTSTPATLTTCTNGSAGSA